MPPQQKRLQTVTLLLTLGTLGACKLGEQGLSPENAGGSPGTSAGSGGSGGAQAPRPDGGSAPPATSNGGAGGTAPASDAGSVGSDLAGGEGGSGGASPVPPGPEPDAGSTPDSTPSQPVSPCGSLPSGPLQARTVEDMPRSDEIAFDNDGRLLAFSGANVVRIVRGAPMELVARNVVTNRGGGALHSLADGDIVIADYSRDRLVRIDARTGLERTPMTVRSPMKIVRGPAETIFVTSDDGIIYRVNPKAVGSPFGDRNQGDTPQRQVVAQTRLALGGLSFSADYRKLYVGATEQDAIYVFPVDAQGNLGREIRWATVPKPLALTTDACGNLYSVGNQDSSLRRITVDGKVASIADLPGRNTWALSFGSGRHGFAADALYALDKNQGALYEIKVGIGETPTPSVP